jgi:O-antigen/teichoic acid export membrane protein
VADQALSSAASPVAAGRGRRGPAVVRSGMLAMVGLVALGGTRLVHASLITRAFGPSTYAEVATLVGLVMTASLFLPGGLASAASKFIPYHRGKGDPATARSVYRWLTAIGYLSAAGLGLVVALLARTVPGVTWSEAAATGVLTAVFATYSVAKGELYGFDRVVAYTWLEIAGSAVAIGATVAIVLAGAHVYLLPLTVGYAVLAVGALVVLRRRAGEPTASVGVADRGEMTGFIVLASVGGLASAGLLQLLPFFAGRFTSADEVAAFGAAIVLVTPLYFLPRALSMALFPAMAHAHGAGDVDAVRRHADLTTRALFVVLAPLFAAAATLAREAMILFGGADYADDAAVLQWILLATYLAVVQVGAVNALSSGSRRQVRIPVFSAVAGAVVGLVALVPLGVGLGGTGVALAYLLAVVVGAAGPIVAVWRQFAMAWTRPVATAVAVVALATGAGLLVDRTGGGGTGRVLLDIGLALAFALVGAVVLARDLRTVVAAARARGDSAGAPAATTGG